MKQSIHLQLGQHLTMTPQLQQAIRLLQLSAVELQEEIQEALEVNPLLEISDGSNDSSGSADKAAADSNEAASEAGSKSQESAEADPAELNAVDDQIERSDMPDELSVDSSWEDTYESFSSSLARNDDQDVRGIETQADAEVGLKEHLLWQADLTTFSDIDRVIASTIIDSIDDSGYLSISLEDILQSLGEGSGVELDEVEAVLRQLQNFDPIGVCSRDLRECLSIQLQSLPKETPNLERTKILVLEYLDLLAGREFKQIMKQMKVTEEELKQAYDLIQTLQPRPGSTLSSKLPEYIIPDVVVTKKDGVWKVRLNQEVVPKLRVNSHYAGMIRRADTSADNTFLKNHYQEARWLIKSLKSRNETMLKVATCIVQRQQGFLDFGEEAMKALVLHDVAIAVDMHESTVSRVTTKKYMHTPRGVFELKYFFSSHVSTSSGGECSSTAIRALIKKLIACENVAKPLSDNKIAQVLSDQGINVARRTVAKYRESMSIPPSNERKRLV